MFNPNYRVLLLSKCFPSNKFICLGTQLISIVNAIKNYLPKHIWYGADVDAISPIPQRLGVDSFRLKKVGDDFSLVSLCENIDQFLSGVFIAVREKNQDLKYSDLRVGTEDEQFRSLDLDGVLIEIRAFDTSYFEIYSESVELINKFSKIYSVKIERFDS